MVDLAVDYISATLCVAGAALGIGGVMSKKFSAQRKRAFLTYLRQSGNQTLSAERAKVSRSWLCLHRSSDAAFDAACRSAIEEARDKIRQTPDQVRGNEKWHYLDGHELVVQGTGGAGGGKRAQVRRAREKQWTRRVENRFLNALAATCNVKLACREVAMWPPSAYNHAQRWPAFARAWADAVKTGYDRLEAGLVETGLNCIGGAELEPEAEPDLVIRDMTAADAIHLLHMHKHQVRGIGKRPGSRAPRVATDEEVRRALVRSLRAFGVRVAEEDLKGDDEE